MSKKKLIIIGVSALTLIALLVVAIPAFAADSGASKDPAQITQVNKAKILLRLLLVRDGAKVDAFLAKAVEADKLSSEQAAKVKDFWSAHHSQFIKNLILIRLLKAQDVTKVQAFLDKAAAAGRLQQAQEDKIIAIWNIVHSPVPSSAAK